MMLKSNAAAHAFVPNGLGAFQPKKKILAPMPARGMRGTCEPCGMRGMGSTLLEQSLAYNWMDHVNDTTPAAMTPEWEAYYGAGGTYSQQESVQRAEEEEEASVEGAVYVNPNLYVTEACSPMDSACVARNDLVQQANFVILANANKAVFMANCRASGRGSLCDQYVQLPVPAVPPMAGSTGARPMLPALNGQSQIGGGTAQQAASSITNQPNQTVPPRGQPGEVATGGGIVAAALVPPAAPFSLIGADGKILGLDPMVVALIAAGVGALVLLKK